MPVKKNNIARSPAMMLAMMLAVMFLASAAQAGEWTMVRASKDVEVLTPDKSWISFERGMTLLPGTTLRTGPRGKALLKRDAESVLISAGSVLVLPVQGNGGGKTAFQQLSGEATYDVERRNVKHFSVDTPYLAAVVKGTKFTVAVGSNSSQVSVRRGVVEVGDYDTGQFALVQRGQSVATSNRSGAGLQSGGSNAPAIGQRKPAASPVASTIAAVRQTLSQSSTSSGNGAASSDAAKSARTFNASAGFRGLSTANQRAERSDNGNASSARGAGAAIGVASRAGAASFNRNNRDDRFATTSQIERANSGNGGSNPDSSNGNGNGNGNAGGNGNGNGNAGGNGNGNGNAGGNGNGNGNAGGNGNGNGNAGGNGNGNGNAGGNGNGNGNAGGNGNGNGNAGGNGNGNGNAGGNGSGSGNAGGNGDDNDD